MDSSTALYPGARVRFTSYRLHDMDPWYYPAVGTVGVARFPWRMLGGAWFVQWPPGATMGAGLWNAPIKALEVVEPTAKV